MHPMTLLLIHLRLLIVSPGRSDSCLESDVGILAGPTSPSGHLEILTAERWVVVAISEQVS